MLRHYRAVLQGSTPRHLIIDNLFDAKRLAAVYEILLADDHWASQKHTYTTHYVSDKVWQATAPVNKFVRRDCWQRPKLATNDVMDFLQFLRCREFLKFLSKIFGVQLTDKNVASPELNTNFFRLGPDDFIGQHADDSPNREVCMLLYLNQGWQSGDGGELCFNLAQERLRIAPVFNRCVLFDPASPGSEHSIRPWLAAHRSPYRYNLTSWYWSE